MPPSPSLHQRSSCRVPPPRAARRTSPKVCTSRDSLTFLDRIQESTGSRDLRVPVDGATGRVPQDRPAGFTLDLVDTKKETRGFLPSRRARVTPEQAGLRSYGSRRVPGLRREEVAVLAGVSVPYYTRLERGDVSGVSQSVLEAL